MSTNYYRKNRPNPYSDIVSISTSKNEDEEIICQSCHCNTVIGGEPDYYCTRCQRTVIVKQEGEVEVADIVESESMDNHNETLISNLPDANESFYKRGRVEPQGAFKALMDRGIHITSYTERAGNGHVTRSWNDGSKSSSSSNPQRSTPRPMRFTDPDSEESEE